MSETVLTSKQLAWFKAKARSYANVMLNRGKIQRLSCTVCGDPKAQMHHTDYTQPMKVQWICRPCHMDIHKAIDAERKMMADLGTAFDLGNT